MDSERIDDLRGVLHEWGLCVRIPMDWDDSAAPTTASMWTHPVAKTKHEKTLDLWPVSRGLEDCNSARTHRGPTRSAHKPALFEKHTKIVHHQIHARASAAITMAKQRALRRPGERQGHHRRRHQGLREHAHTPRGARHDRAAMHGDVAGAAHRDRLRRGNEG